MNARRANEIVLLMVALVLLSCAPVPATGTPVAEARPAGWELVWRDEFDGPAGAPPDPARWAFDVGGEPEWGNREWQHYTNRPENVALDGAGFLAITARRERLSGISCVVGSCDITSGRITTRGLFQRTHGRYEARIRIPGGTGVWPAFWMLGADETATWPAKGEIDIMEVIGRDTRTTHGNVHGPDYAPSAYLRSTGTPDGAPLTEDFHVYGVDWAPGSITWTFDGAPFGTITKQDLAPGRRWVFDQDFFLLLNLAVGGNWPGPPDATTPFPARMVVDWVRVHAPREHR